uniref:Uncharacterized protein n=1 Tax=Arundo donax TaxID=35708 RepID=A0A0A9A165_ARUDO
MKVMLSMAISSHIAILRCSRRGDPGAALSYRRRQ